MLPDDWKQESKTVPQNVYYLGYTWVGNNLDSTSLGIGQEDLPPFAPHVDALVGSPAVRAKNNRILLLHECIVRFLVEYVGQVGRGGDSSDQRVVRFCLCSLQGRGLGGESGGWLHWRYQGANWGGPVWHLHLSAEQTYNVAYCI